MPEPAAPPPRLIPAVEWLVAGIGALLVAATIGYLALHALGRDRTPPDLRLTAEPALTQDSGWLVRFRAQNRGAQPASEVLIEGVLAGPDGPVETAETTLDYLAPDSERAGGLWFSRDPSGLELQLHAKGYAAP
jgi:uncharacterized protein (TIGR02588 family)